MFTSHAIAKGLYQSSSAREVYSRFAREKYRHNHSNKIGEPAYFIEKEHFKFTHRDFLMKRLSKLLSDE